MEVIITPLLIDPTTIFTCTSFTTFQTDNYLPSEIMTAKLFPKIFQATFEVRGASIQGAKCGGTRSSGQSALITFPSELNNVTIHAAWATSYSSGVKLVRPFLVVPIPYGSAFENSGASADEL